LNEIKVKDYQNTSDRGDDKGYWVYLFEITRTALRKNIESNEGLAD
jgi:hypothetical protein